MKLESELKHNGVHEANIKSSRTVRGQMLEAESEAKDKSSRPRPRTKLLASRTAWPRGLNITESKWKVLKLFKVLTQTVSAYSLFTELYRRLTSSAIQLIKLTNQEETPLSYRKARITSNHLARLNTVLASTLRATLKSVKVQTCSLPSTQKNKIKQ